MENTLAPVLLFVYNRLYHVARTVETLQKNILAKESELFIFSDAAKNESDVGAVNEVRRYITGISGFKKVHIIERRENMGCDVSIVGGISSIISKYKKVIEVDDDIITAPMFLTYMNMALNTFEDDKRIWGVSGYTPSIKIPSDYTDDIYLSLRPSSWGLGTWEDRWNTVDWNKAGIEDVFRDTQARKMFCEAGEDVLNSLVKYPNAYDTTILYSMRKQGKYAIFPVVSLLQNIGTDGSGVHFTSKQKKYDVVMKNRLLTINPDISPNAEILMRMKKFYTKSRYRKGMIYITKKLGIYDFLLKHFG
jgi:hypothetical protein